MHSGTTSDQFLRDNLEWLGKASNWAKFSATAALGVIHKGHFEEGMNILGPYLPSEGGQQQPDLAGTQYSEGGSLYALGIVNAGCGIGRDVESYLRDKLRSANNEVVQHGAALGLGIAGMGGNNEQSFEELKQVLFADSAIAGEASGYAIGLVKLGTADEKCAEEMLTYARETQHEKIIRGLAIGLALLFYGRQEQADSIVSTLLAEKVSESFSLWLVFLVLILILRRILFFDMVAYIPLVWHTRGLRIMMRFGSFCMSLYQTRPTMFGAPPSLHWPSFSSKTPRKCPGSSSSSARAIIHMCAVGQLSHLASLAPVPACKKLLRFSSR